MLEVYSGSGNQSAAFKEHSWATREWDVMHGDSVDLLAASILARLLKLAKKAGWAHLVTPCSSSSGDRRGKIGSAGGPLRSVKYPMGLPALPAKEQQLVITGNAHLYVTRLLIRFCILHKILVPLECHLN